MTATAQPSDDEKAYPPRFQRLKRWTVVGVATLVVLAGVRVWWGWEADRRIAAYVQSAHARGRKIVFADFAHAPISDDVNAAARLRQAAAAKKQGSAFLTFEDHFSGHLPLKTNEVTALQQVWRDNESVMKLARSARDLPEVDWGIQFNPPAMSVLLPHLGQIRHLSSLTHYLAMYQHSIGNDREALELCRDMLFEARCLDRESVFIVSHLVSNSMHEQALATLDEMIPELRIGVDLRSANERQSRALITELLDERQYVEAGIESWETEQLIVLQDQTDYINDQVLPLRPVVELMAPMFRLAGLRTATQLQAIADALREPTYIKALTAIPAMPRPSKASMLYRATNDVTEVSGIRTPARIVQNDYVVRAMHRTAAAALAMRLYASQHNGALPGWDQIVPQLLPQVPGDPFSSSDEPLIYHVDPARPVVYSRGTNGRDDRGLEQPASTTFLILPLDIVVRLAPKPPATPP